MPLTRSEAGRRGGLARRDNLTPEQRRESARKAHLASCVTAVVDRAPELTPEQRDRIRAVFCSATPVRDLAAPAVFSEREAASA